MSIEKNKKNSKFWDFIDNNKYLLFFVLITIIAIVIRLFLLKYESHDFKEYLNPWFNELKNGGGLFGLSKDIGNYTPPYMTILALLTYLPINPLYSIKIVSIIFDFILAFTLKEIIEELLKNKKNKKDISLLGYTIALILPTIFLNSACWAQCDQIYTAFVLISILYLLRNNFKKGIIFWSIAFAFKFQAIFIFPLFILYFISKRNIKFRYFLIIPLVLFVLSIPKIIISHDVFACFKTYFVQANDYKEYLTMNFPNIYSVLFPTNSYNLVVTPNEVIDSVGLIITFAIFVVLVYFIYSKKIKFTSESIIEFGLLSILISTFFLPHMHDRYLFMGDVIAIIFLMIKEEKFYLSIGIEIISLYCYIFYLFGHTTISLFWLSIIYLFILIMYSKYIIEKYFLKKNII